MHTFTLLNRYLLFFLSILIFNKILLAVEPVVASTVPSAKIQKINKMLIERCQKGDFTGVVYITSGKEKMYSYTCGEASREFDVANTLDTKFMIGSNTKSFVATIILRLIQDKVKSQLTGKLFKLDGKISDYLPYYPKLIAENVTLLQLMSMRSGIPSNTEGNNMSYFNVVNRLATTPENAIKQSCIPGQYFYQDKSMQDVPYNYSNCNYYILGDIIEKGTGKRFQEVLADYILKPTKMADSGMYDHFDLEVNSNLANIYHYDIYDDNKIIRASIQDPSTVYASGAMYSTVKDFQKWDQILLTEQIINDEYKELMFTPYSVSSVDACLFFGLGWGIIYANRGAFIPGKSAEQCKTDPNRTKVPFYMGSYANSSYVTILRIPEKNTAAMLFFNYVAASMEIELFLLELSSILAEA